MSDKPNPQLVAALIKKAERLEIVNSDLLAALKEGDRKLKHYLEDVKYRQTGRDPKTNGYAYIEMPEWAARQLLDAWSPAIAKAEKQSAGEQS